MKRLLFNVRISLRRATKRVMNASLLCLSLFASPALAAPHSREDPSAMEEDGFDHEGPDVFLTQPADDMTIAPEARTRFARLTIAAEAFDSLSGVAEVSLVINGRPVPDSTDLEPPWSWTDIRLSRGEWAIQALASDWAGVGTLSPIVIVTVADDRATVREEFGSSSTSTPGHGENEGSSGTGGWSTGDDAEDDGHEAERSTSGCNSAATQASLPLGTLIVLLGFGTAPARTRRNRAGHGIAKPAGPACGTP